MQPNYTTSRLQLNKLQATDADFILELVNTDEWIRFIGQRNIKSRHDAVIYIDKLLGTDTIHYWVVSRKEDHAQLGVVTFIKKDYLDHYDIGFAFLPRYTKAGYAFEATKAVLDDALQHAHRHVLATTLRDNDNSIRLLQKLGFEFEKEIETISGTLSVYGIAAAKIAAK